MKDEKVIKETEKSSDLSELNENELQKVSGGTCSFAETPTQSDNNKKTDGRC